MNGTVWNRNERERNGLQSRYGLSMDQNSWRRKKSKLFFVCFSNEVWKAVKLCVMRLRIRARDSFTVAHKKKDTERERERDNSIIHTPTNTRHASRSNKKRGSDLTKVPEIKNFVTNLVPDCFFFVSRQGLHYFFLLSSFLFRRSFYLELDQLVGLKPPKCNIYSCKQVVIFVAVNKLSRVLKDYILFFYLILFQMWRLLSWCASLSLFTCYMINLIFSIVNYYYIFFLHFYYKWTIYTCEPIYKFIQSNFVSIYVYF